MEYITQSFSETQKVAKDFATLVQMGDVLCLYGNLGAGKTTFVQGFIQGLGIKKRIISPTFVIMRSYKTEKDEMFYHVDLYRLESENGIEETGLLEILENQKGIVAIEWPEKLGSLLPRRKWVIHFEYLGENKRKIKIENYE